MNLNKKIYETISKYLDIEEYKVFIFGSRARGDNSDRSDIDIGIDGRKRLPARIKIAIENDLEKIPTLIKFDLIDFKNVSEGFKKEALKFHKILN